MVIYIFVHLLLVPLNQNEQIVISREVVLCYFFHNLQIEITSDKDVVIIEIPGFPTFETTEVRVVKHLCSNVSTTVVIGTRQTGG